MKFKFLLVLLTVQLSVQLQAGYHCPSTQESIQRQNQTLVIMQDGKITGKNPSLMIPQGDEFLVERYGIYHQLIRNAQNYMPFMPGFLMMYHSARSDRFFRRGFAALEGRVDAIRLPRMYCQMLKSAILDHSFITLDNQ